MSLSKQEEDEKLDTDSKLSKVQIMNPGAVREQCYPLQHDATHIELQMKHKEADGDTSTL